MYRSESISPQNLKSHLILIFLIAEIVIYISFLAIDLTGGGSASSVLKYIGVLLCFAFAFFAIFAGGGPYIAAALFFTIIADRFLLFGDHFLVGVIFFLIVQGIYFLHLWSETEHAFFEIRLLAILVGVLLFAFDALPIAGALAIIYFCQLVLNAITAWLAVSKRGGGRRRLFAVGLTLFICCDICVGIYNLQDAMPGGLCSFAAVGMWLFYLPSQVLIALYALPWKKLRRGLRGFFVMFRRFGADRRRRRMFSVILAVLTALVLLSASIAAPVLVRPFYYAHISGLDLSASSGFSRDEIKTAYNEMMDYCLGGDEFSTGNLEWSESGRDHFTDVRRLFCLDIRILFVSAAVLFILNAGRRISGVRPALIRGHSFRFWAGAVLGALFIIIGAMAAVNFDRAFIIFHHIFFRGKSNWIFNSDTDQIITILPSKFFAHCAVLIVAILLAGCALLILSDFGLYKYVKKRTGFRI